MFAFWNAIQTGIYVPENYIFTFSGRSTKDNPAANYKIGDIIQQIIEAPTLTEAKRKCNLESPNLESAGECLPTWDTQDLFPT